MIAVNAAACGALVCVTAMPPRARNPAQAIVAPYIEVVAAAAVYQGAGYMAPCRKGTVFGEGRVADQDTCLVRLLRVSIIR